jgi:threonine dehydratase
VKEEATRGYGAEVVLSGEGFSDALSYAVSQKEHVFIHAFDDDDVMAGQGTIGLEILGELQDVDAVFVPVGGGGLVAGVAAAVKALSPRTSVVGVQTEAAPAASLSFREGNLVSRDPLPTIADGIALARTGERAFELIRRFVDEIPAVDEDTIARSILLFLERKKLVVEGAGAVTLAALLGSGDRYRGRRVVLVLSGGNIDFTIIDRIIRRGLVTSGRIGVFEVLVDDAAGSLHTVTGIIAAHRANILEIQHDRLAGDLSFGKAKVVVTVEVRGKRHQDEIFASLTGRGYEARVKH